MKAEDNAGQDRAKMKEQSSQPEGRSGSGSNVKPTIVGSPRSNPTKGGGINRATVGAAGS